MFPQTFDELTIANLSGPLELDPTAVASVRTELVGQGVGVLCQLARVSFTYKNGAGGPKSVIAKYPSPMEQTRGLARQFKFYEREVKFYKQLAGHVSLPSPRCLYAAHDPASDGFLLLLEDLGDRRLGDQLQGCSKDDVFATVSQIATLHGEWWESPKLNEIEWVPRGESDLNKGGMALYPFAWPMYLQKFGVGLADDVRSMGERLQPQIAGMLDRFRERPRTLCHGDYRLDNMFFGNGSGQTPLTVVDWQIAIQSTGTYDVGYFISQSVSPELRREIELDLLRTYHDRLVDMGVRHYSFADCIDDYRWTLMFCLCYPVMGGGLGDVANERGMALARAMTDRCVAAIRDWKAFEFIKD